MAVDPLEGVGTAVDAQKRAALQALADYGSAGLAQLNQAQGSVKTAQQQALDQAAAGGQHRGEDAAVAAQVASTVARPGNEFSAALDAQKGRYGAASQAQSGAADLYFRELTGAIGASKADSDAQIALAREQYALQQQAKLDAAAAAAARSGGGGGSSKSKLTIDQLLKMIEGQSALDKEAAQAQAIAAKGADPRPPGLDPKLARAIASQEGSTGNPVLPSVKAPAVDQQRLWDSLSRGGLYGGSVAQGTTAPPLLGQNYLGDQGVADKARKGRDALMAALAQAAAEAQAPPDVGVGPGSPNWAPYREQQQAAQVASQAIAPQVDAQVNANEDWWHQAALDAQQGAERMGQVFGVPADVQAERDRAALAYQGFYGLDPQSAAAMAADKYPSPTPSSRLGDLTKTDELNNYLDHGTTTPLPDASKKLDDAIAAKAGLAGADTVRAVRTTAPYQDASQALQFLEQKGYVTHTDPTDGTVTQVPITNDLAGAALRQILMDQAMRDPNFDPQQTPAQIQAVIDLVLAEHGGALLSSGSSVVTPDDWSKLFAAP